MSAFEKILIANRGEIACRIIKTAKKMGIATVAVYSDADRHTLHVSMADEAYRIGPAASAESYLVIDAIIDACKKSGAEAVHPGFGFLSENSTFAEALQANGIAFIGPGVHAMQIMGDKIESKKLAASAGVSTVPGYPDALDDKDQAYRISEEIGCPVMLKASAGGGGKGMRVAWTLNEVRDNFVSAQNEARSAFGDDRVFVEKFIEQPRHIEIQVLADSSGECIALGERECSIQRRHQKVLEEAPSPFINEKTRKAMGDQAVQLAKAVNYCSAGTVEFIVDKERNFFFLEMNTRLQVEHPVTEYITGLDLVEQMIKIAAGDKLPLTQNEVVLTGHSIEARVYAEEPDRNFMPSIGRLTHYHPPEETRNVRVDTGVYAGGEISMYYDPMIAKLVTYGETREQAIESMRTALDSYVIRGVSHNISFLSALVNHPSFRSGDLTTGFIDDHYPEGFDSSVVNNVNVDDAVLLATFAHHKETVRAGQLSGQLNPTTLHPSGTDTQIASQYVALIGNRETPVNVQSEHSSTLGPTSMSITIGENSYLVESQWRAGNVLINATVDKRELTGQLDKTLHGWQITRDGQALTVRLLTPRVAQLRQLMPEKTAPDLSRFLLSPMPGLLIKMSVKEGDSVKAGQELAVVEAMKMENILTASEDAVVKRIPHNAGDSLNVDDVIVEFDA